MRRSKVALPHWLRECIQVTDQEQEPERDENVMAFPKRPIEPAKNDGQSAIDLVYQAAEVVGNLQAHARQTEIRAQTLCRSALEKLRFGESPTEPSWKAFNIAESRTAPAEARFSGAGIRAKKTEAWAR